MELTFLEGWHGEHTREHSLVVPIENTADTGEAGNGEDSEILDKCSRTTLPHHGLTPLKSGIVKAGGASAASAAHLD